MKISFKSEPPRIISLSEFIGRASEQTTGYPSTFIYDGYIYILVINEQSLHARVQVDAGERLCFNLKSQTFRTLKLEVSVEPVEAELIVNTERTSRFNATR